MGELNHVFVFGKPESINLEVLSGHINHLRN